MRGHFPGPRSSRGCGTMLPFSVLKTRPRSQALPRDEASARGRRGCSSRVWSPSFPSKPELYSSLARSHAPPGSASTAHLTRATSRPQATRAPRPHPPQDACHFTGSLPQLDCNLEVRGHQDTRLSVSRAEWKHGWYSGTSLTATTENDKYRCYPRKKKSIT